MRRYAQAATSLEAACSSRTSPRPICPACKHYLRYDSDARPAKPDQMPLQVEGTIRHPADGEPWEYSVVVVIRDGRGNEVARKVVGVGAMHPGDERSFSLSVEIFEAKGAKARKH